MYPLQSTGNTDSIGAELARQFKEPVLDFRQLPQPGLGCDAPAMSVLFEATQEARHLKETIEHLAPYVFSLNGPEDLRAFLYLVKAQPKPYTTVFTVRLGEGHFTANHLHIDEAGNVLALSLDSSPWYYSPKVIAATLDEVFPDQSVYLTPQLPENVLQQPFMERGKLASAASMQTNWKDCRLFASDYALHLVRKEYQELAQQLKQNAIQNRELPSLWHYDLNQLPAVFLRNRQTAEDSTGIDQCASKYEKRVSEFFISQKGTSQNPSDILFQRSGGKLLEKSGEKVDAHNFSHVSFETHANSDQVTVNIHPRHLKCDSLQLPDDATPKRGPAAWWNQATVFQKKSNTGFTDVPNKSWFDALNLPTPVSITFSEDGTCTMKGSSDEIRQLCTTMISTLRQDNYRCYKSGLSQPLGTLMALKYISQQLPQVQTLDEQEVRASEISNGQPK